MLLHKLKHTAFNSYVKHLQIQNQYKLSSYIKKHKTINKTTNKRLKQHLMSYCNTRCSGNDNRRKEKQGHTHTTLTSNIMSSLRRAGFLSPNSPTFDELARNSYTGLLRSIFSNPDHVLRHLF